LAVLLYASFRLVNFAHLCLLYGTQRVIDEGLSFERMNPRLVVSNGDIPPSPQTLLNALATMCLWMILALLIGIPLRRWLLKTQG
jgi:hypothetical protein